MIDSTFMTRCQSSEPKTKNETRNLDPLTSVQCEERPSTKEVDMLPRYPCLPEYPEETESTGFRDHEFPCLVIRLQGSFGPIRFRPKQWIYLQKRKFRTEDCQFRTCGLPDCRDRVNTGCVKLHLYSVRVQTFLSFVQSYFTPDRRLDVGRTPSSCPCSRTVDNPCTWDDPAVVPPVDPLSSVSSSCSSRTGLTSSYTRFRFIPRSRIFVSRRPLFDRVRVFRGCSPFVVLPGSGPFVPHPRFFSSQTSKLIDFVIEYTLSPEEVNDRFLPSPIFVSKPLVFLESSLGRCVTDMVDTLGFFRVLRRFRSGE